MFVLNYRRLPLTGVYNCRDLGGYNVGEGGITQYGRFLRCDVPKNLSESDIIFIKNFGVTLSIDFRGESETERHPSCFEGLSDIKYVSCPTFDKQIAFHSQSVEPPREESFNWGEKYIELLDTRSDWVKNCFSAMTKSEGAVIFNCTTGKDRTGVIAALLLSLAGVSETDIIADYCVSEVYLEPLYRELIEESRKTKPENPLSMDSPFFKTAPNSMAMFLAHLQIKHGGAESYLASCGVTRDEVNFLRQKLKA